MLSGALRYNEQVREQLQAGVDEQWTKSSVSLPYWPIRCDPYSIVDESERAGKPKFRLLNDHSWGDAESESQCSPLNHNASWIGVSGRPPRWCACARWRRQLQC
jgi:hypothetical protein